METGEIVSAGMISFSFLRLICVKNMVSLWQNDTKAMVLGGLLPCCQNFYKP